MNGKPPKFTSTWKTIPNPQFDAKGIYRKELAPPPFMRHYLTFRTRSIPNIGDVYREFKAYLSKSDLGIEAVLADIHAHAGYYAAMALDKETDPELAASFGDLRELNVDVAYPLLLELYQDYRQKLLTRADFIAAVRLVEAYVLRRAVCAVPTNTLNKTFASFAQPLDKNNYLESIGARFAGLAGRYRLPDDAEFSHGLKNSLLYGRRCLKLLLRQLENQGRKEPVPVAEFTIEHILPQNTDLSEAWRADLGPDWQNVQATWLHTLGNLTLTGYNPEYSDRPFLEKRDMPGGFAHSPLRLNEGLGQLPLRAPTVPPPYPLPMLSMPPKWLSGPRIGGFRSVQCTWTGE